MRFANVLLAQQQQRLLLMRRLCFADHLQQPVGSRGVPFRQLHLLPTFSNLQQFHNAFANGIQQKRFGSKKTVKKKFKKDMEYEDEEPELTVRRGQKIKKMDREKREQQLSEEGKTVKFCILSRRLDAILSGSALGKSRTWLDKEISRGSVRVNEHVVTKKSHELEEGDCAELFLKPVDENPKLAVVHQINVLKCPFDPELGYEFQVHVYMDLVTDNWKHGADGRKKYGSKESEEDNDQ